MPLRTSRCRNKTSFIDWRRSNLNRQVIISSVMDLLKTGLFAEYGINSFDFAGHPEGNPDDPNSEYHLLEKLRWTKEREISTRIVTQWSLDSRKNK